MYQATREVEMAVEAPAVSVVSEGVREGGVVWGTGSCMQCVHMQP